jgi:hypothetical protein
MGCWDCGAKAPFDDVISSGEIMAGFELGDLLAVLPQQLPFASATASFLMVGLDFVGCAAAAPLVWAEEQQDEALGVIAGIVE